MSTSRGNPFSEKSQKWSLELLQNVAVLALLELSHLPSAATFKDYLCPNLTDFKQGFCFVSAAFVLKAFNGGKAKHSKMVFQKLYLFLLVFCWYVDRILLYYQVKRHQYII